MSKAVKTHGTCPSCGHDGCFAEYDDESTYCFSCLKATGGTGEIRSSMFMLPAPGIPSNVQFPPNLTDEFPVRERKWLLKYGIDHFIRTKYSIYYTKRSVIKADEQTVKLSGCILLPILTEERCLRGYQLRFLDDNSPYKYLTVGKPPIITFMNNVESSSLVLTEDMLSAIRIAESGANVRVGALLGLGTKREELLLECKRYKSVILWLDDDDAGNKASDQLQRRLKLYTKVFKVKSSLEAKECYNAEIRERLLGTSLIEL